MPVYGFFVISAAGGPCLINQRPEGIRGNLFDGYPAPLHDSRAIKFLSGQQRRGVILPEVDVQAQTGSFTGTVGITLAPAAIPLVLAVLFQRLYFLCVQFSSALAGKDIIGPT